MFLRLLNILFGSKNERELKAFTPQVDKINDLEASLTPLSDEALADHTQTFKKTAGSRRNSRRSTARSFCGVSGNVPPSFGHAAF